MDSTKILSNKLFTGSEDEQAFLRQCLDAMSQGISVAKLIDGKLYMVMCNDCFFDLMAFDDYLRDLPRPFDDFLRFNAERGEYGPGDPEEHVNRIMTLAYQFEPHKFQRTRPNGTVLEIVGEPLPSGDGFVTTYTDITDKKAAEDYMDVLIQAMNNAAESVVVCGPDDRVMFINKAMRQNYPDVHASSLIGVTFKERMEALAFGGAMAGIKGREDQWVQYRMNNHLNPKGSIDVELADGRWLMVNDFALESGHYVSVSTDITELKRTQMALSSAKEEAELASRAKTDFLANMSHELRTPLNSVIGFSELLIATDFQALGMDRVVEYLGDINRSGRHLLRLISDILDISKIEVGEMKLDEETLNLSAVASECMRMIRERARRSDIEVGVGSEQANVWLVADETRLKQILLNLLTNAIKFTDSGGSVELSWSLEPDGRLNLTVTDTGTGISSEDLELVLEPFGQIAGSMTRDHEGAGLGLPLCRRLASLHDATLDIDSELGKGTKVTVTFPANRVIDRQSS